MLLDAFAPEYFVPRVTQNNADVRAVAVTVEHDTFTLSWYLHHSSTFPRALKAACRQSVCVAVFE
jgi:hypothetical protein